VIRKLEVVRNSKTQTEILYRDPKERGERRPKKQGKKETRKRLRKDLGNEILGCVLCAEKTSRIQLCPGAVRLYALHLPHHPLGD
jgi:hypothetical protein